MRAPAGALGVLGLSLALLTGAAAPSSAGSAASGAPASAARTGSAATPGALSDPHPCPDQPGFTCSTLTVPLDHHGAAPGTLDLEVAASDNTDAPRGVLFFFGGGPGQASVPLVSHLAERMPKVAREYRIVTMDQRGTGRNAIDCPRLQKEAGTSDIAVPSRAAVEECAAIVGDDLPYYGTEQSIADYDLLRQALGVERVTVDGASYGAFAAARYAVAHPRRVSRVVLDSVLPHVSDPEVPLYLTGLQGQARVLRTSCAAVPDCTWDPAADLAWLVRHGVDDVALFDLLVNDFLDPNYAAVMTAMHKARAGDRAELDELLAGRQDGSAASPEDYSVGLHAATFCTDARFPWGDSSAPLAGRAAALERAERRIPESRVWPYLPATATGNGFVQTCRYWPATRPAPAVHEDLPDVPVLLLVGDRDLSTPVEWTYEEAAHVPDGRVVVVPGANHSLQVFEQGTEGRQAVTAFLTD